MITDLDQHRVVVLVFTVPGCGACHEYVPRLREVATQYPNVPYFVLDADNPTNQNIADRFNIQATPTTVVARKPSGAVRMEGNVSNEDIANLFELATRA